MSKSAVRTPRQIIERIRTHKFLLDIDSESEQIREGARNLQEQLNNALRLLSEDLYSKQSHFVLELIQNADDNHYQPGTTPELSLEVSPRRLVVVNNELGFTEDNITAICSVGASSKAKDKSGYIGEKGIGFKSVFTVSDAPEIHSNGYHFKFDRTDSRNLLGYVVPHWCEPPDGLRAGCTTIILPAGKNFSFGKTTLGDLDARLLLFLNKLRQLTLEHDGRRVTYQRQEHGAVSHVSAVTVVGSSTPTVEDHRYVRVSRQFAIEKRFEDEKREGITHSTVVLAFPVDEAGAAKPEPDSYVFAFLPIRQMGFKFPIQADFILSSSREEVLADRPWNSLLRQCVAATFAEAVDEFKKTEALAFSYLRFVPGDGEVADSFFRSVRASIIERLALINCLPSDSGEWRRPSELRMADKAFRTLFPSSVSLKLFGFDYVDARVQGGAPLLRSIGVKDVGPGDILELFRLHGPWVSAQPLEWRAKLYGYLADQQEAFVKAGLLKVPCLPVSDGSLVTPSQARVFFPLGRGKKYGFEHELVLVDNPLYEEAQRHSDRVGTLFSQLRVLSDDPYELVGSHILPRHKEGAWRSSKFDALIGHLRYIKDKFADYLAGASAQGKSEAQAVQVLRDGIWIGSKHVESETWRFDRAGALYFGKEYEASFCIESLLPGALSPDKYISADYLQKKAKDPEKEAESWRKFFMLLGVRTSPALEQVGTDWHCSKELRMLIESPQTSVRKATLECISLYWQDYGGRMTGMAAIGRNRYGSADTQFARALKAMAAPLKKRATVSLSDSYYPTPELKTLLGDGLPYIDATLCSQMLEACGITYQLNAEALIKRLKQLKDEGAGTARQIQGIYRALDERFWDAGGKFIRDAFEDEALIQVKGEHKGWFSPSEVSWRSNSRFLDSLYPPIQSHYRDFNRFFHDRLGIPRELPTSSWVDALSHLDQIEEQDTREAEALAIYRRANRDLQPKFGREVDPPDWVNVFQTDEVFIDQRGDLVANDEYLLANDAPELAALFFDEEDLSFIAIPPSEVPRLSRLLDAAGVARLSNSIDVEVLNSGDGTVNKELSARLRQSIPYLIRILYAKHPDAFGQALEEGALSTLSTLTVLEVSVVRLLVSIGDYSRETTAEAAIAGPCFLYRAGCKSLKDRLAGELSKMLGAEMDLADTFARVLLEEDLDNVEAFLSVRGIGTLPPDLLAAVEGRAEPDVRQDMSDGDQGDAEADGERDTPLGAGTDEPGTAACDDSRDPSELTSETERSAGAASPAPVPPQKVAPAAPAPRDGIAAGPPAEAEPGEIRTLRPTTAPTDREKTVAPTPPKLGLSGTTHPLQIPTLRSPANVDEPEIRLGHSTSRAGGAPDPKGTSPRQPNLGEPRDPSSGQSQPQRTKAGRLLSYVEGPVAAGEAARQEDPGKAAARDATSRAAVDYFLKTQALRWKSLTEMPHHNPGFDILATNSNGDEEYIEIKGQSGAWTQEGVALTPRELITAEEKRARYWLCVVEFAQDDKRRQVHLLQDPFGLTHQFRFDSGWKAACETVATVPMRPERELYIDIPGVGKGRILSVREKGKFFNMHVILQGGKQVNSFFHPAKMTLSREPLWHE